MLFFFFSLDVLSLCQIACRELSSTNDELRKCIVELESKFLELARGTVPQSQRLSMVRDLFLSREEELASQRSRNKSLSDSLEALKKQFALKGSDVAADSSRPRRSKKAPYSFQFAEAARRRVPSHVAATNVLLFEVRRLGEALRDSESLVGDLKEEVCCFLSMFSLL